MFRSLALSKQQLSRCYATAAKPSIKVPLTLFGIDGRYATALFQAAATKNTLEAVESDLEKVGSLFTKSPKLQEAVSSPLLSKSAKDELINSFGKQNETTTNFFQLLIENNRLSQTENIIKAFKELMNAHRGVVTIKVTSSKALDSKILTQVQNNLTKNGFIKNYKDINVVNKVNPSILGGMIVEFGDYTIDMSAAARLAKLDKLLSESISI